jgi:hypothetical protein
MATEAKIRKEAKKELELEGYLPWCPAKVKFRETDVFGIFDCIAVKDSELRFIQWTTRNHIPDRRKKIMKFFDTYDCFIPCEIWGWDEKLQSFKKEYI